MIQANLNKLNSCAAQLGNLTVDLSSLSDQISSSIGFAAESEKELFQKLQTLSSVDLPELFALSSRLLSAIARDYQRADQNASSLYQGGGQL